MVSVSYTTTLKSVHLHNSEFFRDEARRVEAIYSSVDSDSGSSSVPEGDKSEHRAYCMNSIISTACFLESTINALYWDLWDDIDRIEKGEEPIHYPNNPEYRSSIKEAEYDPDPGEKKLSKRLGNAGILGKYNIFLDVAGSNEFEKDIPPAEPVNRVLDIRNELVHFKPRWIQGGEKDYTENEYEFEADLKGRYDLNPLLPSGNAFFPDQSMSYGCAEWALRVSRGFVRQFSIRVNLQIHSDITLPF